MLFSSLIFLFVFLPSLFIAYYLFQRELRNYVLVFFSLLFYAWGGLSYSIILILSISVNYFFVKRLEANDKSKKKWLISGLIFNTLVLVVFKYLDFIIENINDVGFFFSDNYAGLPLIKIVLPLGISFFTFHQMSLLWDIYRDPKTKKTTFSGVVLYISLFPQLIAGPIVRYKDIEDQINNRKETFDLFRSGVTRFIIGLFKKIVIANSCAEIADSIIDGPFDNINTPIAWLGIIAYAFQIYFDFSGYSDMAIGLARMFGFRLLENFNFPYISKSIQEFWRRWHISLSTWFRDYVYIPIGGNRQGPFRTYFNLILVFLLTGFWHGATWSFVVWGLLHGSFLIIEKLGFSKVLKKLPGVVSWSYTMFVVLIAWVLFRIEFLDDAFEYIGKLFGAGESANVHFVSHLNIERVLVFILALLFSTPIFMSIKTRMTRYITKFSIPYILITDTVLIAMLVVSVMYINSGSYNPFIYFRF